MRGSWVRVRMLRVWAVLVGVLLVVGVTGPAGAVEDPAPVGADLVAQVAGQFDEAWVHGSLWVPQSWRPLEAAVWQPVAGSPGVFALAARMAEDTPARVLVSTATPLPGTWLALLDGTDHRVKSAVELPAEVNRSRFTAVEGVAAGDVLLFVDTTGVWAGSPDRVFWVQVGLVAADLPTVRVDDPGPAPSAPILAGSMRQFREERSSAWMALGPDTGPGQMVTFAPNLSPVCSACWPAVRVYTPDGELVTAVDLPRADPSVTFAAGPGYLVHVVTATSLVYDAANDQYLPVVVRPTATSASAVPRAPMLRTAVARGPATLLAQWSAPTWPGTSPVSSFTATASPGGASCTAPGDAQECEITVPDARVAHTVTVTATNASGTSPASAVSASVVYRGSLPSPVATPSGPRSVVATQSGWDTVVTWAAPASPGGAPISEYEITLDGGTRTVPGSARSVRMYGTNGHTAVTHTVLVVAFNLDGYGQRQAGPATGTTLRPKPVVSAEVGDRYADKLFVNMTPNRSTGYWLFRLDRRTSSGTWAKVGTYRTYGVTQTRTLNLPRGTYRVRPLDRYGYAGVLSDSRYLVR